MRERGGACASARARRERQRLTVFLLIRHASNDFLGRGLAGRTAGVHLNAQGRDEAAALAERLRDAALSAIYVSPRERAGETAAPLAARLRLTPRVLVELDEIDFGTWSGKSFGELEGDAEWTQWVTRRSAARPPGGETIVAVQRRMVAAIERLRLSHTGTVALVTHGDVIKAALAHFLRLSLDELERFEIAPASVSVVAVGSGWSQVKRVNDMGRVLSA